MKSAERTAAFDRLTNPREGSSHSSSTTIDGGLREIYSEAERYAEIARRAQPTWTDVIVAISRMISVAPVLADMGIDARALRKAVSAQAAREVASYDQTSHDGESTSYISLDDLVATADRTNCLETSSSRRRLTVTDLLQGLSCKPTSDVSLALFQSFAAGNPVNADDVAASTVTGSRREETAFASHQTSHAGYETSFASDTAVPSQPNSLAATAQSDDPRHNHPEFRLPAADTTDRATMPADATAMPSARDEALSYIDQQRAQRASYDRPTTGDRPIAGGSTATCSADARFATLTQQLAQLSGDVLAVRRLQKNSQGQETRSAEATLEALQDLAATQRKAMSKLEQLSARLDQLEDNMRHHLRRSTSDLVSAISLAPDDSALERRASAQLAAQRATSDLRTSRSAASSGETSHCPPARAATSQATTSSRSAASDRTANREHTRVGARLGPDAPPLIRSHYETGGTSNTRSYTGNASRQSDSRSTSARSGSSLSLARSGRRHRRTRHWAQRLRALVLNRHNFHDRTGTTGERRSQRTPRGHWRHQRNARLPWTFEREDNSRQASAPRERERYETDRADTNDRRAQGNRDTVNNPRLTSETEYAAEPNTRFYLSIDDPVVDAPSIGPRTAGRLEKIGIYFVRDLLAADVEQAAERLDTRHITAAVLADWQAQARLVLTIPWLRGTHAQLLVGAGYRTAEDIQALDTASVLSTVLRFAASRDGQRILRDGPAPAPEKIEQWIANAALAEPARAA